MFRAIQILMLFFCVTGLRAQDLIVTTSGDSIHCTITTAGQNRLFYTVKDATGDRRDNIDLGHVAMYKREGYFPVILGAVDERAAAKRAGDGRRRWMMSFSAGYSHRTAPAPSSISDTEKEYIDQLRKGLHASGALHYLVNKEFAVGAEYNSFFASRSSMAIQVLTTANDTLTGELADDVRLRFVGLDLLYQPTTSGKIAFRGSVGIGYLQYVDRATLVNDITITGETVAFNARIGLELPVSDVVSIGARLGYFVASVNRFEVDTGSSTVTFSLPDNQQENLNRFDLGIVLRVRL